MKDQNISETSTDPWEELANAIVLQAVKDYRLVLRTKEHSPKAAKTIKECERFFRSSYFGILTTVDPEYLIKKLRKETEQDGRN